jgi:hypothetical protein
MRLLPKSATRAASDLLLSFDNCALASSLFFAWQNRSKKQEIQVSKYIIAESWQQQIAGHFAS